MNYTGSTLELLWFTITIQFETRTSWYCTFLGKEVSLHIRFPQSWMVAVATNELPSFSCFTQETSEAKNKSVLDANQ